jgi:hypothetical protein
MDGLDVILAAVLLLVVLGAAATAYGVDSRESSDECRLPTVPVG